MTEVAALLRIAGKSNREQIEAIHQRLPATTFRAIADFLSVPQNQLANSLKIQPRTLRNRLSKGKLSQEESEKSLRVAKVFSKSKSILGDNQKAREWMFSRIKSLGEQRPIDLLDTDVGTQEVLNVLYAIEWGVFL